MGIKQAKIVPAGVYDVTIVKCETSAIALGLVLTFHINTEDVYFQSLIPLPLDASVWNEDGNYGEYGEYFNIDADVCDEDRREFRLFLESFNFGKSLDPRVGNRYGLPFLGWRGRLQVGVGKKYRSKKQYNFLHSYVPLESTNEEVSHE